MTVRCLRGAASHTPSSASAATVHGAVGEKPSSTEPPMCVAVTALTSFSRSQPPSGTTSSSASPPLTTSSAPENPDGLCTAQSIALVPPFWSIATT